VLSNTIANHFGDAFEHIDLGFPGFEADHFMMRRLVLLSVVIAAAVLIPGGPFGPMSPNHASNLASNAPTNSTGLSPTMVYLSPVVSSAGPVVPDTPSATLSIPNFTTVQNVPSSFWGVNVAAAQKFTNPDAAQIAATPATYIRFPGGSLGEELNYTSGVLTSITGGGTSMSSTSIQMFISSCRAISCHAILQLPAEIDQPQTAAYYASYVENTLHFKPAYWEIGNAVGSWAHFDQPWSAWGSNSKTKINATLFADELQKYVIALRAVVSSPKVVALGMALGEPNNDLSYISTVARVDGKNLSAISVHSYALGTAPNHPTWAEFLANLNGKYSLNTGVQAARNDIKVGCANCNLKIFVTEANGAEDNDYTSLLPSFAGTIYVAADTVQALNLRLKNLDWFAYDSHYQGAWVQNGVLGQQYTLMSEMMTHLGREIVPATVTGPSSFYLAATYGTNGLAVLLVNANVTHAVSLNLVNSGILSGAGARLEQWKNGSLGPTNSTLNISTTLYLPELSISILSVGLGGLLGPHGSAPTSVPSSTAPPPVAHPAAPHQEGSAFPGAAPEPLFLVLRGPD
jgi:hypothetical protein